MVIRKNLFTLSAGALLLSGLFSGCLETDDTATPPSFDEPAAAPAHWLHRSPCDNIACSNPDAAAAECSNIWGESSNRTYDIFSLCTPNGTTTNSDCYSDCFRNYCQCGSTAGTPNACGAVPPAAEPNCECGTAGAVNHRYWCCGTESDTIQGWSDVHYCGTGGFGATGSGGGGGAGGEGGSGASGSTGTGAGASGSTGTGSGAYGVGAYGAF